MRIILVIAGIAAGILIVASVQYIPEGRVGALDAGASVGILDPGLHLRPPWNKAALYPVEPSNIQLETSATTPGGTFASRVDLEISVNRDKIPSLYRSYGTEYASALISPLIKEYLRRNLDVSGSYPDEVARTKMEQDILAILNASLGSYGLACRSLSLQALDLVTNEKDARIMELARLYGGKVVILGIDALDWEIYREVSQRVPLPNLERLIRDGATGDLLSIEPLVSPMIWTTMATGVEPQVHGIIDFLMKDATTGENVPITSTMRRVPALWNILTSYGLSSGFIGWLGTYPAEPVRGFMVSDRIVFHTFDPRWQQAQDQALPNDVEGLAYPESLIDDIRPLILGYEDIKLATLRNYIDVSPDQLTPQATTFDPLDPIRNLRLIIASNTTYEQIARYTYRKYQPQLFSVYLDMVDNVCHLFIKHMEPHTSDISAEEARRFDRAVDAAYAHTDSLLGQWMDLVDQETTLIMVSDHGFKSGDIRPSGPSAIGGGQAVKWHRTTGAIALYGHRVKNGVTISQASVLDVAPTLLRLLGLPVAKDMPGRILEDALDQGWLASSSKTGEIETYGARTEVVQAVRRADEEAAILERLKALGYVGGGSTDLKKLAASYFSKGEFDKAIEIWRQILQEQPDDLQIMASIGNALLEKGDLAGAFAILKEAVEKDPDFADGQNLLGICYINMNRIDDAQQLAMSVLARDPKNARAYFNLGVVFDKRGLHDQALSAFKRSVELRTDYDESRINLANEYLRRGSFKHARIQVRKALEINPNSLGAWYLLGKVHAGMGERDSAMICYREALKIAPDYNPARVSLAAALAETGFLQEAKQELEAGLQYPDELTLVHLNLGLVNRYLGDLEAAEKHLKEVLKIDQSYLPARFDLADLYLSQGDKDKARDQLEAVLKADPANHQARMLLESIR